MAFLSIPPEVMRPTALVLNILVATIATYRFARAGHFSHSLFWPFAIGSVPLAFVGGSIQLPGHWYKTLVGVVLLLAALRLLRERRGDATQDADRPHGHVSMPVAIVSGAIIGLLSGLTGTGGGIFLSPLLLFTGWAVSRRRLFWSIQPPRWPEISRALAPCRRRFRSGPRQLLQVD